MTLRTRRLELSPPVESDVDAIWAACQDPDIQRYTTVPSPYELRHAEEFVVKVAAEWASGAHLTWAVRHGSMLAGMIGLYRLDGRGAGELGFWIARPSRGKGFVTEASTAVLDWGFAADGLGLARIEWRAITGNVASARAARTLGFRFEGTLRQGLADLRGRHDGWIAGLLAGDDRTPQPWPALEA